MQPRLFIGSSSESLYLAKKMQQLLHQAALVQLWNQDLFHPGDFPLPRLIEAVAKYDFAAFLISPDDIAEIRGQRVLIARDNVVFEAGLFFSHLGKERTMLVAPASRGGMDLDFHLPSDLAGISLIRYYPPMSREDWAPALGSACTSISEVMERLQVKGASLLPKLSGGPILLLRHLATRGYDFEELVMVVLNFNGASVDSGGWEKATKYALLLLTALDLVAIQGGDEYVATTIGRQLLDTDEAKHRFSAEFSMDINTQARICRKHTTSSLGSDKMGAGALEALPTHIKNYLSVKGYKMISFERVRKQINPACTDTIIQELIDSRPNEFRRTRMEGGKQGIGIIE